MRAISHEEQQIEHDRRRQQQLPADRRFVARLAHGSFLRRRAWIPHRQHEQRDRKADNTGADKGAAPAPDALQQQKTGGRCRRSEHAGESVNRKSLTDALGRHMLRQQRVVGRVVDGVADAGEREHRHQEPERVDQTDQYEGDAAERKAYDQQHARAQPVDQKARRRLKHRRDDVEGGERQAELVCS